MYLSKEDIANTPRVKRLNIINSVSGIKSANLIGTSSVQGQTNLAVFNSVVHIGSNPPLLGFIMRPLEVRRHTYENIQETGKFTINHIHNDFIEQAHYTSAKFDEYTSEFDACGLTPQFAHNFKAPFVKESQLKMGLALEEIIPIKSNGTYLIVGQIEHLILPDKALSQEGYINLEVASVAGISGLNLYYKLTKLADFPYARVDEVPKFK